MFPRMFHLINCEKTETLTRFYRLPVLLGGGKVSPLKREQQKARTKKEAKAVPGGSSPPLTDRQQPDCFMVMEPPPHQPAATQSRGHPHFGRVLPSGNPGKGFGERAAGPRPASPRGCAQPGLQTLRRLLRGTKAMDTHPYRWHGGTVGVLWGLGARMKLEKSSLVPWDAAPRRDGLSPVVATLTVLHPAFPGGTGRAQRFGGGDLGSWGHTEP